MSALKKKVLSKYLYYQFDNSNIRNTKAMDCFNCGERGHFKRDCPHLKRSSRGRGDSDLRGNRRGSRIDGRYRRYSRDRDRDRDRPRHRRSDSRNKRVSRDRKERSRSRDRRRERSYDKRRSSRSSSRDYRRKRNYSHSSSRGSSRR